MIASIKSHLEIAENAAAGILAKYDDPEMLGVPVMAVIKGSWLYMICSTEDGDYAVDDWSIAHEAVGKFDMGEVGRADTLADALALVDFDAEAVAEEMGDPMELPRIVLQLAA